MESLENLFKWVVLKPSYDSRFSISRNRIKLPFRRNDKVLEENLEENICAKIGEKNHVQLKEVLKP